MSEPRYVLIPEKSGERDLEALRDSLTWLFRSKGDRGASAEVESGTVTYRCEAGTASSVAFACHQGILPAKAAGPVNSAE